MLPGQLAYLLYKNTGMTEQFNSDFVEGVKNSQRFHNRTRSRTVTLFI